MVFDTAIADLANDQLDELYARGPGAPDAAMTTLVDDDRRDRDPSSGPGATPSDSGRSRRVTGRQVALRRGAGRCSWPLSLWALVASPAAGAPSSTVGGVPLIGDLLGRALQPAPRRRVPARSWLDATVTTLSFAVLGTVGALSSSALLGGAGAQRLSPGHADPPWPVRLVRAGPAPRSWSRSARSTSWSGRSCWSARSAWTRWSAVLAIALPFGAQTAQVFAETFDALPTRALRALRGAGARPVPAFVFALLPPAGPLMLSYSFYRSSARCARRSSWASSASAGWARSWWSASARATGTRSGPSISAVLAALGRVERGADGSAPDMAVASCSEWSAGTSLGRRGTVPSTPHWIVVVPGSSLALGARLVVLHGSRRGVLCPACLSDAHPGADRRRLVRTWSPPALPRGGAGDGADRRAGHAGHGGAGDGHRGAHHRRRLAVGGGRATGAGPPRPLPVRFGRWISWLAARIVLLVLRSVPPTVWAVIALLALFPGVLPGALALASTRAGCWAASLQSRGRA